MPYGLRTEYGGKTEPKKRPRIVIPQTTAADTAKGPKPKMVKRGEPGAKPKPPMPKQRDDISVEDTEMPRAELSQALLKGAALVPQFSGANTLRGILGGAGVGMEIGDSIAAYRKKKEKASLAKEALAMKPAVAEDM